MVPAVVLTIHYLGTTGSHNTLIGNQTARGKMMARKTKARPSLKNSAISRYSAVFRELREAVTGQYLRKLKGLAEASDRVINELSDKDTFWLAPEYLEKAREEVNFSQYDLQKATGLSRSIIAKYETGLKVPTLGNLHIIYSVLEKLGSLNAINGLRAISELDKSTSLMALEMIAGERKEIDAREEAVKAHVVKCAAEISRLDALVLEKLGNAKWGR